MDHLDWSLVRAFHAAARAGSLSAAARDLGLTQPTLSRQVAALEKALGVTLFERVGRGLVLTEAGQGLVEPARAMARAAEGLSLAAAGEARGLVGKVTISVTDGFAAYVMPEVLEKLREAAPGLTIAIVASNALSDLRRREADIAIRHARPSDPELIGRLLRETTVHFYASEAWVDRHGLPATIADLVAADHVGFDPLERYVEALAREGVTIPAERFRIVSENAPALWEAVKRGLGVGLTLREIGERTPGVVGLLPDMPGMRVPMWLVSHRELRTNPRVRLAFDVLAEAFGGMARGG